MISEPSTPQQDLNIPSTPDEITPTLRPWCTPRVQQLGKADTDGGQPGFTETTVMMEGTS
jgi:hypothetical protein